MLLTDIHVRAFPGPTLKSYLHSIAKLRADVFQEFPYLQDPDLEKESVYLDRFVSCKEAIGVLVFDNTTLIGASLGLPLSFQSADFQQPFLEKEIDIHSYFFFGDSILLKPYRGRGIGHHFFDVRESHVYQNKKYKHICFCLPARAENLEARPADYLPLNDFWQKRGYSHHPRFVSRLSWNELGQQVPSEQEMTFWIKDLYARND